MCAPLEARPGVFRLEEDGLDGTALVDDHRRREPCDSWPRGSFSFGEALLERGERRRDDLFVQRGGLRGGASIDRAPLGRAACASFLPNRRARSAIRTVSEAALAPALLEGRKLSRDRDARRAELPLSQAVDDDAIVIALACTLACLSIGDPAQHHLGLRDGRRGRRRRLARRSGGGLLVDHCRNARLNGRSWAPVRTAGDERSKGYERHGTRHRGFLPGATLSVQLPKRMAGGRPALVSRRRQVRKPKDYCRLLDADRSGFQKSR